MKKNLVFIMTDHQRFDSIFMEQCGREVTPNLNKLANSGTNFTKAYTACPLCVPARTALATGVYPTSNGVVYNDFAWNNPSKNQTLHSILLENGYEVAHFGVNHIRTEPRLKSQNFADFFDEKDYNDMMKELNVDVGRDRKFLTEVRELEGENYVLRDYSNPETGEVTYDNKHFKDRVFADKVENYLPNLGDKPFALFVCLWAPHPPLVVPKGYYDMYPPEKISMPQNVGVPAIDEPSSRRKNPPAQLCENVSEEKWRKTWSAHLALQTYADELLGELLGKMENLNLLDNTTILFTADHGENLGQHKTYQKMEMYEQSVHVPLIIKDKDLEKGTESNLISHIDIVPSLCEMLDLKHDAKFDGKSLLTNKNEYVFSQYSGNSVIGTIRRCVISDKFKYVLDQENQEELFDLVKDKEEIQNVADFEQYKEIKEEMSKICRDYHLSKNDFFYQSKSE